MKKGLSVWIAFALVCAALVLRLLFPAQAEELRTVFWNDAAIERVYDVFSPAP